VILIYDDPVTELKKGFARWDEVKQYGCRNPWVNNFDGGLQKKEVKP